MFFRKKFRDESLESHVRRGARLAPGVTLRRREVLKAGAYSAAALAFGGVLAGGCPLEPHECDHPHHHGQGEDFANAETIEGFLQQARPMARRLVEAGGPDEDSYVEAVARLVVQFVGEEPWNLQPRGDESWAVNLASFTPPIVVYDIVMDPGATIPLHDHRHHNGVFVCHEGRVRCLSFDEEERAGDEPRAGAGTLLEPGEILLRKTADETLHPGQVSALTRTRDNVHQLESGPDGARLVDVFTFFNPEARSDWLEWDGGFVDEAETLCKARMS